MAAMSSATKHLFEELKLGLGGRHEEEQRPEHCYGLGKHF
jgi:hypothetical protein